jgi:hypothetical protein
MSDRPADEARGRLEVADGDRRLRATMDALLDPHVVFEAVRDDAGAIVDFRYADANAAACAYNRLSRRDLVGARLLQRLPGVRQSGLFAAYCRVVETGEPLLLDGATYESDLAGPELLYYDIRGVKLGDGLSLTWRDVTDRHHATEALRAQRDLAVALSRARTLPEAFDLIMEAALALEGVDCGSLHVVDPETGEVYLAAQAGLTPAFASAVARRAMGSSYARLISGGASVFASFRELSGDLRDEDGLWSDLRAAAAVPIREDGLIVAALNLASRTCDEFARQEAALIEALAAQAGGVLVRLREEASVREELARLRRRVPGAGRTGDAGPAVAGDPA